MVNFQAGVRVRKGHFTVNIGVVSPRLLQLERTFGRPPVPGALPRRNQVQLEWRLEALITAFQHRHIEGWWKVAAGKSPGEVEELAASIVGEVVEHGLPFLQPFLTDAGIRDSYLGGLLEPRGLSPIEADRLLMLLREIGPASEIQRVLAEARHLSPDLDEFHATVIATMERNL